VGIFNFTPADFCPVKDRELLARLAKMTPEEIVKHPNPDLHIRISLNIGAIEIADMYANIVASDKFDKPFSMICGNPNPDTYIPLANLINMNRISCRNLIVCTMDEWADEDGNVAPLDYQSGFSYSFFKYFVNWIDPELRPKPENIHYPTTKNIKDYTKIITEASGGGVDTCYSGPGWAGHIAFIDPCPEYMNVSSIEEYLEQPAKIVTLHPLTIAQNSLHGVFGCSGNIGNVPPKAATIGPLDVVRAKRRLEFHGLTTMGTFSSWQRMTSRLITHGPVTPAVPGSIFQKIGAELYISEEIAKPIECLETVGY
jgi:6-phosphogluconolactonase/glucosamine-6-phosphate isomerase/deaminase